MGDERANQVLKDSPVEKEKDESMDDRPEKSQQKEDQPSTMELDRDQEMTPSEWERRIMNCRKFWKGSNLI